MKEKKKHCTSGTRCNERTWSRRRCNWHFDASKKNREITREVFVNECRLKVKKKKYVYLYVFKNETKRDAFNVPRFSLWSLEFYALIILIVIVNLGRHILVRIALVRILSISGTSVKDASVKKSGEQTI
jgi:hypothetical protein